MESDCGVRGGGLYVVDDEQVLTLSQVSELLDIPAPTIRSWERRYAIGVSGRAGGAHRRYSNSEVATIRQMRDLVAGGHRPSQAAALLSSTHSTSPKELVTAFLHATQSLQPIAISSVLESARQILGLGRAIDEVLLPALREVGERWAAGVCDVAHEHLASETARSWLAQLSRDATSERREHTVVLACGPRDHHTLGVECLSALLDERGVDCRLLGARTPATSLVTAVREVSPGAVVVVSHLAATRASAIAALRSVDALVGHLFYAGNAFRARQARVSVPGTYLGDSLTEAADEVSAALAAGG